jgi:thymidylate kinase
MTDFWVLLGPDFAGKSSALARGRDEVGWQVVSHDDAFVDGFPLVRTLRGCWVDEALRHAGTRYSAELVLTVLHAVILHQRDELLRRAAGPGPVVMDSYYYKVLAACTLLGVTHETVFAAWRAMPQPKGVVYLDVPPEVTWERSGQGARATAFEHYGPAATHDGFVRMQRDLRAAMLAEIRDLPVTVLDATAAPDAVLAKVAAAIGAPGC